MTSRRPHGAIGGSDTLGTRQFFELTGRFTAREWEDAKSRSFLDQATGRPRIDLTRTHDTCPLCGATDFSHLFDKDGWPHYRCAVCGGIFVSPCLTQSVLDREVYGATPYPFAQVVTSATQVRFDTPRFEAALETLETLVPERTLLDVGCGGGLFLDVARQRGWDGLGTEPLDAYRALAVERLGPNSVLDRTAARLDLGDRRFGAITFWEVMDHVEDPHAIMEACRPYLAPGGVVLIYVRNAGSLAARVLRERCNVFLGYAHLTFWTADALTHFAERHRMALISVQSRISELGPVNNYLAFDDPYRGAATPVLPLLDAAIVEGAMLGYKLLALFRDV